MLLDPVALLFTNFVVGLAVMAILWLSQVDVAGSKRTVHMWVAADTCLGLARVVLLLQPGVLFAGALAWLTPAVAATLSDAALLAGVTLHTLALHSVVDPRQRRLRALAIAVGVPALYTVAASLLATPVQCVQLMLLIILGASFLGALPAWTLRRESVGSRIIVAAKLGTMGMNGALLMHLTFGGVTELPMHSSGAVMPPLQSLIVDLTAPLFISMGFVLLLQERLRALIERLSHTDSLTHALNRRGGMLALEAEVQRVSRHGGTMSVAMLDLDHFKRINDDLGHAVGDEVLTGFAKRVQALLRVSDRLVRWGGEEFLVLMPETDGEAAARATERIRQAVGATALAAGAPLVTVSVGVSAWTLAAPQVTLAQWLNQADERLYRAKESRDCVVWEEAAGVAVVAEPERTLALLRAG